MDLLFFFYSLFPKHFGFLISFDGLRIFLISPLDPIKVKKMLTSLNNYTQRLKSEPPIKAKALSYEEIRMRNSGLQA